MLHELSNPYLLKYYHDRLVANGIILSAEQEAKLIKIGIEISITTGRSAALDDLVSFVIKSHYSYHFSPFGQT